MAPVHKSTKKQAKGTVPTRFIPFELLGVPQF